MTFFRTHREQRSLLCSKTFPALRSTTVTTRPHTTKALWGLSDRGGANAMRVNVLCCSPSCIFILHLMSITDHTQTFPTPAVTNSVGCSAAWHTQMSRASGAASRRCNSLSRSVRTGPGPQPTSQPVICVAVRPMKGRCGMEVIFWPSAL